MYKEKVLVLNWISLKEYKKTRSEKWCARVVNSEPGSPYAEIRKYCMGGQLFLIVSLGDGYNYKFYKSSHTKGINVHMATNGPIRMTFEGIEEMYQAIQEAKTALENI